MVWISVFYQINSDCTHLVLDRHWTSYSTMFPSSTVLDEHRGAITVDAVDDAVDTRYKSAVKQGDGFRYLCGRLVKTLRSMVALLPMPEELAQFRRRLDKTTLRTASGRINCNI